MLGDGLHYEVNVGQRRQVGPAVDPLQDGPLLRGGELSAGHRARGRVLDMTEAVDDRGLVALDSDDGQAVAGKHLGDARAHGAESDNADLGELT